MISKAVFVSASHLAWVMARGRVGPAGRNRANQDKELESLPLRSRERLLLLNRGCLLVGVLALAGAEGSPSGSDRPQESSPFYHQVRSSGSGGVTAPPAAPLRAHSMSHD